METKKTASITFRCRKKLVEKLPPSNKHTGERSQYLNDAVQNYQELLELQLEGKLAKRTITELSETMENLSEQCETYREGLIKFFILFQQNAELIEITNKQQEFFAKLLGMIQSV
ncbi:hypothetical protein [Candidatus Lokiarchaeum ossiferum]|uniref:hypothetical protein n=1 Tax=Candidatus Lokiarchaeum ossiferum TaxID=2951803 RepID=UPI00352EAA6D